MKGLLSLIGLCICAVAICVGLNVETASATDRILVQQVQHVRAVPVVQRQVVVQAVPVVKQQRVVVQNAHAPVVQQRVLVQQHAPVVQQQKVLVSNAFNHGVLVQRSPGIVRQRTVVRSVERNGLFGFRRR